MDNEMLEIEKEASEYILGAMMVDAAIIPDVINVLGLTSSAFTTQTYKRIYDAIIACYDRQETPNPVLVAQELGTRGDLNRVGGIETLYDFQKRIVETDTENIAYYAGIIKQGGHRRLLLSTGHELVNRAGDEQEDVISLQNEMQEKLFSIGQNQNINAIVPFGSVVKELLNDIEALSKKEKEYNGISTGFTEFDVLTSGLQPKDLIIIASRPGMGKTTFVLNIATYLAIDLKTPVGIFSLEMSQKQIGQRMLAADSQVDFSKLHTGNLDDKDWEPLTESANLIMSAPLHIDDTRGMTVQTLRAKVRQLKTKEEQLGLIIVDYLQLLRTEGTHRRNMGMVEEISEISRELKTLAWEMECTGDCMFTTQP